MGGVVAKLGEIAACSGALYFQRDVWSCRSASSVTYQILHTKSHLHSGGSSSDVLSTLNDFVVL